LGWQIGFDSNWNRDIGYGVPATCDRPGCGKPIDRGLSYVCGGEPYGGEHGCGLYFCEQHLTGYRKAGDRHVQVCGRCNKYRPPYDPTPDTREWIEWKLADESWAAWRAENPEAVTAMKAAVNAPRDADRTERKRELRLEQRRRWREKYPDYMRQWRAANRERVHEYEQQYYEANRDRKRDAKHLWHEGLQKQVFDHYGWSCACCGSTEQITIDHVEGDGRQHREQLFGANYNGNAGRMYRWLIDNGFPEGFQALCRRCNRSKGTSTECRLDHGGDS